MEINPSQFGDFNFKEMLVEMNEGRTVNAEFGLILKPVDDNILLQFQPEDSQSSTPSDIESFPVNEQGLKRALIAGFGTLSDWEAIDGFQIENEDAENFERESFEVINLDLALQDLVNARRGEPDHDWYINVIGRGDVEDPTLISGLADFDIKDAPLL